MDNRGLFIYTMVQDMTNIAPYGVMTWCQKPKTISQYLVSFKLDSENIFTQSERADTKCIYNVYHTQQVVNYEFEPQARELNYYTTVISGIISFYIYH